MTCLSRRRIKWIFGGLVLLFLGVVARVVYVNLDPAIRARLDRIRNRQYKRIITVHARRGMILDARGNKLAMDVFYTSIYAVPRQVRNKRHAVERLSSITGVPPEVLRERLKNNKREFVWIKRRAPDEEAARVKAAGIRGVGFLEEPRRVYPNGDAAAALIGFMGMSGASPPGGSERDLLTGREGIERSYDSLLRGKDGFIQMERDAVGRNIPDSIHRRDPFRDGGDVYLTMDLSVQHFAEQQLKETIEQFNAKTGSVIVVEVRTGRVLAMANYPTFDPNDMKGYPGGALRNQAVTYVYEPGSTFKVVAAAAALDTGILPPDTKRFYCGGSLQVGSKTIHDAHSGHGGHGQISVEDIIRVSCNIGVSQLAMRLGGEKFEEYIRRFGFGKPTGIRLTPEETGIMPRARRPWSNLTLSTVSFGQGISVTPLQMAMAYAAIANDGILMRPAIVDRVEAPNGKVLERFEPTQARRVLSSHAAAEMRRVLRAVVADGTGTLAEIENYGSAGKTGTSQMVEDGRYVSGKYVSSFIGFAPLDDPKILVYVAVTEPRPVYYGGAVAAPAFKTIAQRTLWYMGIMPDTHFAAHPAKAPASKD